MGGKNSIQTLGKEEVRWSTKNPDLEIRRTGYKEFHSQYQLPSLQRASF